MARPRIFAKDEERVPSFHVYLHKDQYEWIRKKAHERRMSPSAMFRQYVDFVMQWETSDGTKPPTRS